MDDHKPQFDVYLGGKEEIPYEVGIKRFVESRTQEMMALTEAIDDPQRKALVFQSLPKHMRRRIMSHNIKRMPVTLRNAHLNQFQKGGLPTKTKRPSRKYRRYPKNLLVEYNRRQRKNVWLETHIWHAKRFHMIEKWGYKIANFPNDKSFRACYRASSHHCLLQDISYLCCIELSGCRKELINGLNKHTNSSCGLSFAAKCFVSGKKEGKVTFFKQNSFPYGVIGDVLFMWQPLQSDNCDVHRTIWIWIHPAFYSKVLEQLKITFEFEEIKEEINTNEEKESGISPKKIKLGKKGDINYPEKMKIMIKNIPFHRIPKFKSKNSEVKMVLLKDTLNRFRILGPLSQAVLSDCLLLPCINISENENDGQTDVCMAENNKDQDLDKSTKHGKRKLSEMNRKNEVIEYSRDWWKKYYKNDSYMSQCWEIQRHCYEQLKGVSSSAQLPPHLILGLNIRDPRYQMPQKRTKSVYQLEDILKNDTPIKEFPAEICSSAIWVPWIRDSVTTTKKSASEFAKDRSKFMITGFCKEEFEFKKNNEREKNDDSCIPVILIQKPGSQDQNRKRIGYGSGWDIILPAGWGMPLWMSLIFHGARVGGLRESESLEFESANQFILSPDSEAGQEEDIVRRTMKEDVYFRLPPKKRPNFIKLGTISPFSCPWKLLLKEWYKDFQKKNPEENCNFYVLREKSLLQELKDICKKNNTGKGLPEMFKLQNKSHFYHCLIPVYIKLIKKGKPRDCSMICIPFESDVKESNRKCYDGPVEEIKNDEKEEERKMLRSAHQKHLKHLRRKRIMEKKRTEESENCERFNSDLLLESKKTVEEYIEKMKLMWLPPAQSIKNSCSREIMGFATKGDFSFTEARGFAVGYVTFLSLIKLCSKTSNRQTKNEMKVLIRNPSSRQYRFATMNICTD